MDTNIIRLTSENTTDTLSEAAALLQRGEIVVFPTETVYGLGADARNPEAVEKIFEAKGRPFDNPLIVHVSDTTMLESVAHDIPDIAYALFDAFSPGPLTIILPKHPSIPYETTGNRETVAVRIPSHPFAHALIERAGTPIAAPSANRSGKPSGTNLEALEEDFTGIVPLIIDAGESTYGLESTVVHVTPSDIVILRPGAISREQIAAAVNLPVRDAKSSDAPEAPGMRYRHYAPNAQVVITRNLEERDRQIQEAHREGLPIAVLSFTEEMPHAEVPVFPLGSRTDLSVYAHTLYQYLREADRMGAVRILVPEVDEEGLGAALMNRIRKAVKST